MSSREYIEKALALQFGDDQEQATAIDLYQRAIRACGSQTDGFDYLYAHYELMRMHADSDTEKSADYGRKCLDILAPIIRSGAIMHFTDQGKFHEEVIRYATNSIAWHTCLTTEAEETLEEALGLLSSGEAHVEGPEHAYLLDTKVRLLLKLNRTEEAYQITRTCLIDDPLITYFDDILADEHYISWKKAFEQGINLVFSEEEKHFLEKAEDISRAIRHQLADVHDEQLDFSEQIPKKEIITREQATQRFDLPDYFPSGSSYILFKGDLHVVGPLNMDWVSRQANELPGQPDVYGLLVDGDLVVNGDVLDDNYLYIYVRGNLRCDYLFSYNGQQIICGDAFIRFGTYGEYNDGQLDVYGKLHTPYIITDDHAMPTRAEDPFIYMEAGDGTTRYAVSVGREPSAEWGWIWTYFDDSQKLFAPEFWTAQDRFSIEKFLTFVRAGKNPFILRQNS